MATYVINGGYFMKNFMKCLKKWLGIKSPSKAVSDGLTREDIDAIIGEINKAEWEAKDYFDHIFESSE